MAPHPDDPASMPDIDIRHPHSIGKQACRAAVEAVAADLARRHGITGVGWRGDTLHFAGRGVAGSLTVGDDEVHARVRLGLMFALLRPVIEAEILRQLRERIG
jgi:putative polyhydroxyalkanoate system protein